MHLLKCPHPNAPVTTAIESENCVSGMMECMATYGPKMEAIEKRLTSPKAMEKDDNGQMKGSCPTAIKNRVEGEHCCTAETKSMVKCVESLVGDYKACKDSWNKNMDPGAFGGGLRS